jgi:PAS domain S-box-containing protein
VPRAGQLADLIAALEATPLPCVVTDPRRPDNPIVAVNAAFERLTGYAGAEAIGRNCRFLQGPGTDPRARAALRNAVDQARPATVPILNYRRDGAPFLNAVTVAPMRDEAGALAFFLGSHAIVAGETVEGFQASREAARARVARLAPRQRDVLGEMARGGRNKAIAHALGISERMVKAHKARLLLELGAASAAEAIRLAVEAGL